MKIPDFKSHSFFVLVLVFRIGDGASVKRNVVRSEGKLWINRVVPFIINPDVYNSGQIRSILSAMKKIMNASGGCIQFVERTVQSDYIYITKDGGCCSPFVGRKGGKQTVSLGNECSSGNAMHEFMHVLGFFHEHTRPDRDQYITVNFDNIIQGYKTDFEKSPAGTSLGLPYDYYSIMHYSSDQFSRERGYLDTITPKDPDVNMTEMGQRRELSALDIRKLRELYSCDSRSCKKPVPISHGIWYGASFNVGDTINYACDQWHQLVGAGQRTCKFNGKWSGASPMCLPVKEQLQYCNFESEDLCGWIQDTNDDKDWNRFHGRTPSLYTGPISDHTFSTYEGHYAYMEGSLPVKKGDVARLMTPRILFSRNTCLLFFYCMNGKYMGNLTVQVDDQVVKKITGNKGPGWKMVYIKLDDQIESSPFFQVIFEATRGIGALSDIAIDDVMVGSCNYVDAYVQSIQAEENTVTLTSSNKTPAVKHNGNAFTYKYCPNSRSTMDTGQQSVRHTGPLGFFPLLFC